MGLSSADRVYVSLGTAGRYPGYGPVYRGRNRDSQGTVESKQGTVRHIR